MNASEWIVILAMIAMNGVFAAYELALASIRPERLRMLAEAKRRGAKAALAMKNRMEASLAVVQLGITFFGAIAAALGGASVAENLSPVLMENLGVSDGVADALSLVIFVVPMAAVSIIVGELIPKSFGLRNPDMVCLALSPMMQVFAYIAFPAVWFFEKVTKVAMAWGERLIPAVKSDGQMEIAEWRAQVNMLRASQVIGVQQERIILQASRLSTMRVKEIMLPVQDIVMLWIDAPLTECIIAAHLDLHTRFPVTEKRGDPQAIIGYINFKEMIFLAKTHPTHPHLREITRPLIRFTGELAVSEALKQMVGEHVHLALVLDSAGKAVGMITQEDIFEELVGDIQDEFDRLPRQIVPSGRQWIAGGGATLTRLRELLGKPELGAGSPGEMNLNDWIEKMLGRRPHGGDVLREPGLTAVVRKIRRNKVAEVLLDTTGAPLDQLVAQGMQLVKDDALKQ